jgi:hypothetical protein
VIGGRAMARNLEEIIQSEDPKVVSAAKRKASKILRSINDKKETEVTEKKPRLQPSKK